MRPKFALCLFCQCPRLCTICHSWQHTCIVHLSLQADGEGAFEEIPVFGVSRPTCHDSSLYLFVQVIFHEEEEEEEEEEETLFDPKSANVQCITLS